MPTSQKNSLQSAVDYYPAQVSNRKICRIFFYATNPETQKLERVVVKCNRIKDKTENYRLARRICVEINAKLATGWNPFIEKMNRGDFITTKNAAESFIKNREKELRPDSMRSYRSIVKMFVGWLEDRGVADNSVTSFSSANAESFIRCIGNKNGVSARTRNNYLRMARTMFNYFIDADYIKENPFAKIHMKREDEKRREVIPPDVRAKIKAYFLERCEPYFYIMQLCYKCLIRPKEILMLKVRNIDFKNQTLKVPAYVAKNHNERTVAIPDDVFCFLSTFKELDRDLYLFSTNYKPGRTLLNTRDTARTWSQMRDALNLPKEFQFYSLKDTGITEMLESGVPAKLVKDLADHHSLEMMERYTRRSDAKKILKYDRPDF